MANTVKLPEALWQAQAQVIINVELSIMTRHGSHTTPLPVCRLTLTGLAAAITLGGVVACTPTVRVEAPTEPITINLNVRIEHEIRVRVDRELDDIFAADSGLF